MIDKIPDKATHIPTKSARRGSPGAHGGKARNTSTAMKIELLPIKDLIPYANNAKTHSEDQIKKLAASIKEFGFNNPVLVDGSNPPGIIAGHGRVLGAALLKLEEVPCIRLGHLNETQKKAYILADNRLAEVGTAWDIELVKLELEEIEAGGINPATLGFESWFGDTNIDDLGEQLEEENKDNPYTAKIEAPIYEPKGDNPPAASLVSTARYDDLLIKINAAKITQENKDLLRLAAARFLVFDYQNIAEFYTHADKKTKDLMEELCLVIIDHSKAIELGFLHMTTEINNLARQETGKQQEAK
jgi:hypothetical protein